MFDSVRSRPPGVAVPLASGTPDAGGDATTGGPIPSARATHGAGGSAGPAGAPSPPAERELESLRRRAGADTALLALRKGRDLVVTGHLCLEGSSSLERSLTDPSSPVHWALAEQRPVLVGEGGELVDEAGERAVRGSECRALAALPVSGFTRLRGVVVLGFRRGAPDRAERLEEWTARAEHVVHAIELEEQRWRHASDRRLFQEIHADLERRVHRGDERRRTLVHILADMNGINRRLSDQRKAMIHILADYEGDRRRMAHQTERLDNSRRALLNILKDSHTSNQRLADSRKAMIHIMGDLNETTNEIQRRERELRDKQEQLVQAGKLATLGELTTGVAHELNNPLNNIGLAIGNVIDLVELGRFEPPRMLTELTGAMLQVRKATEIITHLRTFGRAAPVSLELISVNEVVERSLALLQEQFRLREIRMVKDLSAEVPMVVGNPIQLEQVTINLLSNARDALAGSAVKQIILSTRLQGDQVELSIEDTGSGIPQGLERRIFDPFFTTKDVGSGTGLGLSITYGIIREHGGSIQVASPPGRGARFIIRLPRATPEAARRRR